MKKITVAEAKPGMILARPISDRKGRVIVGAGAQLTQLYISRLAKWGVSDLCIEEAGGSRPSRARRSGPLSAEAGAENGAADDAVMPPGVYRGRDLAERIGNTFTRVADDPLMIALRDAVVRRLTSGGRGE
jgi:hypothetical protein